MERTHTVSAIQVNNEWRDVLIVLDTKPIVFNNLSVIVTEGESPVVYQTDGYLWRIYTPDQTDGAHYAYWFLLAKDQGAADIANQLAQDNAVLQEAANILRGVE